MNPPPSNNNNNNKSGYPLGYPAQLLQPPAAAQPVASELALLRQLLLPGSQGSQLSSALLPPQPPRAPAIPNNHNVASSSMMDPITAQLLIQAYLALPAAAAAAPAPPPPPLLNNNNNNALVSALVSLLTQQQGQVPRALGGPTVISSSSSPAAGGGGGGVSPSSSITAEDEEDHHRRRAADTPSQQQRQEEDARFSPSHQQRWEERFAEMKQFVQIHGHACVPIESSSTNPALSHWVKRQRHQKKAKEAGRASTLSDAREERLNSIGFVWDSHAAAWEERWNQLRDFYRQYGHSNVPTTYPENQPLAVWVKCQRRQYQLWKKATTNNNKSYMTQERYEKLNQLKFLWCPRGIKDKKKKKQTTVVQVEAD